MNAFATAASAVLGAAVRFAEEKPDFDPNSVTPGVIGFVATFLFAAAVLLLIFDMHRRVRRTRYRAEVREMLANERAEGPPAEDSSTMPDGRDSTP